MAAEGARALFISGVFTRCNFFSILFITVIIPALPTLAVHFSLGHRAAQCISSLIFYGSAVSGLIYGFFSDSFGRKPMLILALGLSSIFSTCSALSPSAVAFIAFQLFLGLNLGAGMALTLTIIKDFFKGNEAAKFISILGIIGPLAGAVGPLVGGNLLACWGWQSIYYFIAAVAGTLLLGGYLLLPETLGADQRVPFCVSNLKNNIRVVIKDSTFLRCAFILFLLYGGLQVYNVTAAFMFMKHMHATSQEYAFYVFISSAGVIAVNSIVRCSFDRFGLKKLLAHSSFFSLAGGASFFVVTALASADPWHYAACIFIYTTGLGISFSTALPLGMDTANHVRGFTSSLLRLFQMLGAALSTSLVAIFYNHTFWPTAFFLASVCIGLWILTRKFLRQ